MIDVRVLGPDDWQAYREVRLAGLAADPDAFLRTVQEEASYDEAVWRGRLDGDGSRTWAAEEAGRLLGVVTGLLDVEGPGTASLVALWVRPEARGRGLARVLSEAVVEWAREQGRRRLLLWVADTNATAQTLYRRLGFAPTGRTDRFDPPREHITEHEQALDLAG